MTGRIAALAVALWTLIPAVAGSQDSRLELRMDGVTFAAVRAIIDSARRANLPTRPIEDKALEGAGSGATGPAILVAVRTFTRQLSIASNMLGRRATSDELRAAVSTMEAGVPPRDLMRIHTTAPDDRSIATALTVLGDIVARGVPVASASTLLISLLRAKVTDPELLDFARVVREDLSEGADPGTAASARARGVILTVGTSRDRRP